MAVVRREFLSVGEQCRMSVASVSIHCTVCRLLIAQPGLWLGVDPGISRMPRSTSQAGIVDC